MTRSSDRRPPVLLLPPSRGKAAGGDGPPYEQTLSASPLDAARREVLHAVRADVAHLDDMTLARVAGVRAGDVEVARRDLLGLADAPTMPAHRRYTGIVHGNAGLASLDPAAVGVDVRIVSALAGLVDLAQPLPPYRLEFAANLPSLGGLATWWRGQLADHLQALVRGRQVWDLLPGDHARIWDRALRQRAEVAEITFVRPDGRAANAARTKVCKGRLAAFLIANPDVDVPGVVAGADPGAGWKLQPDERGVRATYVG